MYESRTVRDLRSVAAAVRGGTGGRVLQQTTDTLVQHGLVGESYGWCSALP